MFVEDSKRLVGAHSGLRLALRAETPRTAGAVGAPPKPKLIANHVTVHYGDTLALDDVCVPVYLNEVTAFIGPSGCGKTTLIRVFNRMHELYPDRRVQGEVLVDGVNVLAPGVDPNVVRARIGMVFQEPAPFPMSIYANVAFGLRAYETLNRAQTRERVEAALRSAALWTEVKDILSSSALRLSGGQQQRLCIARAIAMRPDILLLDEPCSALDPKSAAKIEETIDELRVDHTIAIVTHNLQQAARVSSYTAFMYLGRIVEFGPSRGVFETPKDERTARYVTSRFG